jgi:hypothetical protein
MAGILALAQDIKVFCFFSSEKKDFHEPLRLDFSREGARGLCRLDIGQVCSKQKQDWGNRAGPPKPPGASIHRADGYGTWPD